MKNTKIQWCHSTVNPVMGCDGCELWPGGGPLGREVVATLGALTEAPPSTCDTRVREAVEGKPLSVLYADREDVAQVVTCESMGKEHTAVVDVFRRRAKCYAGLLGTMRGGHAGYADQFEIAKRFPGRMAKAAAWGSPTADEIEAKPWLQGLQRLIFISDMGDALSSGIPLEYLQSEMIDQVGSIDGRRHVWLWLTKRPARMARFGEWLARRNVSWPDNLVAMTTVTAQATASRVAALRKVPSKLKGLSVEPLFEPVDLDLNGLDWVIVGGGSDVLAEPFHVEWTLDLSEKCRKAGVAFFLKQLGRKPSFEGRPLKLENKHGGDWSEWPREWRVRELPRKFRSLAPA